MRVLVLVVRGLHLGYVGCYGNEWVETPTLDRLAAEGIVFDQHYADQPDAAGALRAWQTGCYRFAVPDTGIDSIIPQATNLFPSLADQGIGTFLVGDARTRSLSTSSAGWQQVRFQDSTALGSALDQLAAHEQWLLRFDLGILLPPWDIPEEFRDRYTAIEPDEDEEAPRENEDRALTETQDHYAAAVTYLDKSVGEIVQ